MYSYSESPSGTIVDGMWLVGSDIQPGLYRTSGPSGELNCEWGRLQNLSEVEGIFLPFSTDGTRGYESGPTYVEIKDTDKFFYSDSCEAWTLVE